MFTGLVEEVGTMKSIGRKGEAMLLGITGKVVTEGLKLGDSIAVNGVCLTAVSFDKGHFTVDVMPQTYRHSNLKELKPGSPVNLERAMAADGRFGGHIVQGHVDGIGKITTIQRDQNAVIYEIQPLDEHIFRYIIPQGSIAIDGISLTVISVEQGRLSVSIIPHTLAETALIQKREGDTVNLECDCIGKYVEHLLKFGRMNAEGGSSARRTDSAIDMSFLNSHGFV